MKTVEKALVRRVADLGARLFRLDLHAPQIAARAWPASFVMVRTTVATAPLLCRPFSIYQTTSEGGVQILFRVVGQGTANLSRLRPGDEVMITGPLGNGFDLEARDEYILVAGGVGIAPVFMAAKELVRSGATRVTVMAGAATAAELTPLTAGFAALGVDCALATDDGSLGHHGFVTDLLKQGLADAGPAGTGVLCCGPAPMMAVTAGICERAGIWCQVSLETVMACGISACLGCTVPARDHQGQEKKYLHVCKDGPVFMAGEIEWKTLLAT